MKKWAILIAVAGFPACAPQVQECVKIQLAVQLACGADLASPECVRAQKLAVERCGGSLPTPGPEPTPVPTPTPTPTPEPTPPPIRCAVTLCPPGKHCVEGVGCVADEPPPPAPCVPEGELVAGPNCAPSMQVKVVEAMNALGDPTGMPPQETLQILALELVQRGLCAHAGIEAVFVKNSQGLYEEYHAVSFATGGWTWNGKFIGCHHVDVAPPVTACSEPRTPAVTRWNLKPHGRWFDSTPLFYGAEYCTAVGFPDRLFCPARSECPGFKCEERVACERLGVGGFPLWRCEKGEPEVNPDNPYQARCFESAWIEVCSADQQVCTRAVIP